MGTFLSRGLARAEKENNKFPKIGKIAFRVFASGSLDGDWLSDDFAPFENQ